MARKKSPPSPSAEMPKTVKAKAKTASAATRAQALTPELLGPEDEDTRPKKARARTPAPDDDEAEYVDSSASESDDESDDLDGPIDPEVDESEESPNLPAPSLDRELSAISPTDPLRRYLEEVRRYPLLSPEEEFKLAQSLIQTGDKNAARRLVQANLRLVIKIAFEYKSVYANVMDLIQEGNVGLMKAVSKYDPSKGAKLGYYSSWWIRSYILKYLLDNFRLVRIGTTQAQKKLFFHLMREKERLEAQGVLAAPRLLADRLDVREKDVVEMEQRLSGSGGEISLDAPISPGAERSTTFTEFLPDDQERADDRLAREQLLKLLHDRLPDFQTTLNDKEKRILQDRLLSESPKTLQEVADLYGLTRERARQIEVKVIQKLREFLRPAMK